MQVEFSEATCSAPIPSWLPRPPSGGGGKFHLQTAGELPAAGIGFGFWDAWGAWLGAGGGVPRGDRRGRSAEGGPTGDRQGLSAGLLTDRRAGKADPDTRPAHSRSTVRLFSHSVHGSLSGMFSHSSASHRSFGRNSLIRNVARPALKGLRSGDSTTDPGLRVRDPPLRTPFGAGTGYPEMPSSQGRTMS